MNNKHIENKVEPMYSRTTSIYGVSEFRIKNNQLLISKHRFKKQKEKQKGKK